MAPQDLFVSGTRFRNLKRWRYLPICAGLGATCLALIGMAVRATIDRATGDPLGLWIITVVAVPLLIEQAGDMYRPFDVQVRSGRLRLPHRVFPGFLREILPLIVFRGLTAKIDPSEIIGCDVEAPFFKDIGGKRELKVTLERGGSKQVMWFRRESLWQYVGPDGRTLLEWLIGGPYAGGRESQSDPATTSS